ncbi:MAG: thiazole synthase [Planctomycetota bacterium]
MTAGTSDRPADVRDPLVIGGRTFASRLLIGTGKFPSPDALRACIERSGSEIVTVALRRVDLREPGDPTLSAIDTDRVQLLPNTSGARDADEAVRLAQLARKLTGNNWVKLEVTPDPVSLLPDPIETLRAAEILVKEQFVVLPYCHADLILARRLEAVGCATVMPLGSPIGTNKGLRTRDIIGMIIESISVPVVVDAGIGVPSHACEAMEMGASAVLVNTALALAADPGEMGAAFGEAVRAGRRAYLAGPGAISDAARASSPLTGFLDKA